MGLRQARSRLGSLSQRGNANCVLNADKPSFDAIEPSFDAIELGFDAIEPSFHAIEPSFDAIELSFHAIESSFDAVEPGFNAGHPLPHFANRSAHFAKLGAQIASDIVYLIAKVAVEVSQAPQQRHAHAYDGPLVSARWAPCRRIARFARGHC